MQPFVGPGYYILINAIHSKLPFCYSKLEWKTNASERTRRIWNGYAIACECKSESKFAYDFFFSIAGRPNAVSRPGTLVPKEFVFANIFRFSLFIIFCLVHGILFCECRFFFFVRCSSVVVGGAGRIFLAFPVNFIFSIFIISATIFIYDKRMERERGEKNENCSSRPKWFLPHEWFRTSSRMCAHAWANAKVNGFRFFFSLYRCFWWWTFNQSRNSFSGKVKSQILVASFFFCFSCVAETKLACPIKMRAAYAMQSEINSFHERIKFIRFCQRIHMAWHQISPFNIHLAVDCVRQANDVAAVTKCSGVDLLFLRTEHWIGHTCAAPRRYNGNAVSTLCN